MYFDFEDRLFDTPTIEPAMSWRERALLSLFAHLAAAVLVLVVPRLQFVQDAAARRAERLAEMAEEQQLALLQERSEQPKFIFVAPLVDSVASVAPSEADLSDLDRVAQSPVEAETPLNDLPNAEGNSFEFIESVEPSDGLDPATQPGDDPRAADTTLEPLEGVDGGTAEDLAEPDNPDAAPGDGGAPVNPILASRGGSSSTRPPSERPGTILNQALRGLDTLDRRQSFHNLRGRTDRYGPDIQFDSKGVDFGSWLRRFRAQIYRNWFIPYAAMSMSGNVVLTFDVHKDGAVTDLTIKRPSAVDAFTNSAFNAMRGSNPTYPLPPEYPDDHAFFTVTFYFNERPPGL